MEEGEGGGQEKPKVRGRVMEPVRKGRGEVGVSKMETEVGVKMACPLGRRRGERPIRECDKAESGRK